MLVQLLKAVDEGLSGKVQRWPPGMALQPLTWQGLQNLRQSVLGTLTLQQSYKVILLPSYLYFFSPFKFLFSHCKWGIEAHMVKYLAQGLKLKS